VSAVSGGHPLRAAWLIWIAATLSLSVYFVAGYVASRGASVPITLSSGFIANQKLFRFGHDRLRMELEFRGNHTNRPELGEYTLLSRPTGHLEFSNPGAEILLKASSDSSEMPLPYSALPKTAYNQFHIYRNLVAELVEAHGTWKWPPTNFGLALKPGMNDVRIEVATVAPELAGEGIRLLIHPEIGFKSCGSQVCWLWGWFAWPFFLFIQSIWALVLFKRDPRRATK
jgi:hypothetical protein